MQSAKCKVKNAPDPCPLTHRRTDIMNSLENEPLLMTVCELESTPVLTDGRLRLRWFWLAALLLGAVWMVVSIVVLAAPSITPASLWNLQNPAELLEFLSDAATVGLIRLTELLAWGLLVALAVGYLHAGRTPGAAHLLLAGVLSLSSAAVLVAIAGLMVPLVAIPLSLACLSGVWIGWSWSRGGATRRWLLAELALLLILTTIGIWQSRRLVFQSGPADLPAVTVTSADKRHLVSLFRNGADEDGYQRIQLAPHDVDLLLAWAISIESRGSRARVRLQDDSVELHASWFLRPGAHVPIQTRTQVQVAAGELDFRVLELRIGRLQVPGWLSGTASAQIARWVVADPESGAVIRAIRSLRVRGEGVTVVLQRQATGRHVRELIVRLGAPDRSAKTVRAYVEHLLAAAEGLPSGEERFAGLLQAAFALAERRSEQGDPIQENRAAIYALGIVTGHVYVEWAAGRVLDAPLRKTIARQMGRATVRGRADWVRHYSVSAALTLWSSENASDAAGLLKEELDAGPGGSGFSFSDLLANRAGMMLAIAATKDTASARRIQQALAEPWDLDQFFPAAADLPEGLSDAELQAQYGGVDGVRYRQLIDEIENRVKNTLPAKLLGER